MSKIIKYNNLTIDNDNKFSVDVPIFNEICHSNFDDEFIEANEMDYDEVFEPETEEEIDNPEVALEKARIEADEIITAANEEAERIIANANAEAEALKKEAFAQAEKQGYDDGFRQALEETQEKKEEAESLLENAKIEKQNILNSAEPEMVELVVNIINKLVNNAQIVNKDVIKCVIKKGLSQTKIMGDIFIHVSADDFDDVTESKEDIVSEVDGNAKIEIVKDLSLKIGDCLIETPFGNIDCSISQQLEEVKNSLNYILENR